MKRMVKNGDLIDVEPDGTITVAGKPIGGGSNDKEITLKASFNRDSSAIPYIVKIYVEEDIWNNIKNFYYETVKFQYDDGSPMAIFTAMYLTRYEFGEYDINAKKYTALAYNDIVYEKSRDQWYGYSIDTNFIVTLEASSDSDGKYVTVKTPYSRSFITLKKDKFDALYKLADKPTGDGTYVLKATVSGGAVTYTWVAQ